MKPTQQNPNEPGDLADFDDDDLKLVIEEGRRQLDSQNGHFEHVQGRAQSLLTIGLAVLAFAAGSIHRLHRANGASLGIAIVMCVVALLLIVIGVALAAAVIVVRADFDQPDTTQISKYAAPRDRAVAADYAACVRLGEITVATRITVFRTATRYTVWAAVVTVIVYLLTN